MKVMQKYKINVAQQILLYASDVNHKAKTTTKNKNTKSLLDAGSRRERRGNQAGPYLVTTM
jgi:hypothetical protein